MIYTDKTKKAIKLCFEAHAGQKDKSGLPYAHHPLHLADLAHNSDLSRLDHEPTEKDLERVRKYHKAREILLEEESSESENRFKPGDIVQHFKRELLSDEEKQSNKYLYEIIGVATHSETQEPMMVYKPLYDDCGMYVRPLEMFLGEVDHEKYPDIQQKNRFEKTGE